MTHPPKVFIHGTAVSVTSRIEEGLPLVPTGYMNLIIKAALGAAQDMYPVKVIAVGFRQNHLHMVLVVETPECAHKDPIYQIYQRPSYASRGD